MKTSTKVILKFQIFTVVIIFVILLIVNFVYFKLTIISKWEKVPNLANSIKNRPYQNIWWKRRNWQIVDSNWCFIMYQQKFCISDYQVQKSHIYKIDDYYFYYKPYKQYAIIFDITQNIESQHILIKISLYILLMYLILSYPIWMLFLRTIYKKIFFAINDLQEKNYINVDKMKLSKNDELYVLFRTINNQIDTISSFNKYLSHELKTPLMNIISNLDMMKLVEEKEKKIRRWFILEKIQKTKQNVLQIKKIIDALNNLILIETKNFKVEKDEVNVYEIFDTYAKEIWINYEIKYEVTNILTNKDLFEIVVKNILDNAKKYNQWKVEVYIWKKLIQVINPSKYIKNISKLTDRFYKESNNWLWIWLYLVKKIVRILWYKLCIDYNNWKFVVEIKF